MFSITLLKRSRLWLILCSLSLAYVSFCIFLFVCQRHLIYRPSANVSMQPDAPDFGMDYQDVWMPVAGTSEQLHGWWLPASADPDFLVLPDEPQQVLSEPKVMLYFCGVGRNMGDYNYLARVAAFRQLGFSVLVFDYRGYGQSQGSFPSEQQLYDDAEIVWNYLRQDLGIAAEDVVIYGESMGGAVALSLAVQQPDAAGLIMQSSFTTMAEAVEESAIAKIVPTNLILTEKFDSLQRIKDLKIPVLFLHGNNDSVVPVEMSHQLYAVAPAPKQQFIIPNAEHVSIYQPDEHSYLKAIQKFVAY